MLNAKVDDATLQTMITLLKDGMAPTFVARVLKTHGLDWGLFRFFSGPVIIYEPAKARLLPAWLIRTLYVERLELVIAEDRAAEIGRLATIAGVLAYLHSVALADALTNAWAPIYGHVAFETTSRHSILDSGEAMGSLFDLLLTYQPHQLTEYEQQQLLTLRRDIRRDAVKFARTSELVRPRADRSPPLPPNTPSFQQVAGRQWPSRRHRAEGSAE